MGVGDAVFVDEGFSKALVVEVKSLHKVEKCWCWLMGKATVLHTCILLVQDSGKNPCNARNKARNYCRKQAERYLKAYRDKHPEVRRRHWGW
jgi:hypothetical protein